MSGLGVFWLHVLLGPPIGALLIWLYFALVILFAPASALLPPGQNWAAVPGLLAIMVLFSYFFGGLQAVGCGVWLGRRTAKHGSYGYVEAALAALVVGAVISGTAATLSAAGFLPPANSFRAWMSVHASLGLPSALILRAMIGLRARRFSNSHPLPMP